MVTYRDWVVELSNTTGTGTYSLAGAPAGTSYFTFRQRYANGAEPVFWVVNPTRTKWEKNRFGTLTYGTPDTLSRNVVESTNGDAPLPWVAGDLPLRIYVAPDADVEEGVVTGWLSPTPSDLLRYGFGNKEDDPSAGLNQLFFRDGNGTDIDVAVVDPTAHSIVLDPTLSAWRQLGQASPVAASSVDFTGIPASINHLMVLFEFQAGTDGADIRLRTYDAAGSLDSGAADYQWVLTSIATSGGTGVISDANDSFISLTAAMDNGASGCIGKIEAANIQASTYTKFLYQTQHLNTAITALLNNVGGGLRIEADRITGLSIFPSVGTITGKITLYASV